MTLNANCIISEELIGNDENAFEWPPFSKWPPTKSAKFQCSLISMKIDI
jgi:hypothetical protein